MKNFFVRLLRRDRLGFAPQNFRERREFLAGTTERFDMPRERHKLIVFDLATLDVSIQDSVQRSRRLVPKAVGIKTGFDPYG